MGEAWRSNPQRIVDTVANAVSRRSSVRVLGGFTAGKWFVSLTGEVPTRPPRLRDGKPTYKSTMKSEAMREERKPREQEAPIYPDDVSPGNLDGERRNLI